MTKIGGIDMSKVFDISEGFDFAFMPMRWHGLSHSAVIEPEYGTIEVKAIEWNQKSDKMEYIPIPYSKCSINDFSLN